MNHPISSSPERIMQVGLGFWSSKALLTAVDQGLFTELAKGPRDRDSLSQALGLHHRSARDFFDALVSLGFLNRTHGVYSNTPDTDLFLDKNKPSYIGGMLEMANNRLYRFWDQLPEALRSGEPQNEIKHGRDLFDDLYANPARLKEFLAAMTGLSHGANLMIGARFPWKDYKTFIDLGTAQGDLAVQIAKANPHLTGHGLDLPVAAPIFEEYVQAHGVADRLKFQSLDFFKSELPHADVITMGHILHDWDLETKLMLIKKAYNALPQGGALVVYEAIIDDDRSKNSLGLLMSLNMLIETRGGFDFTGADCSGWMKQCGFRETRVEVLTGPESMVIGLK